MISCNEALGPNTDYMIDLVTNTPLLATALPGLSVVAIMAYNAIFLCSIRPEKGSLDIISAISIPYIGPGDLLTQLEPLPNMFKPSLMEEGTIKFMIAIYMTENDNSESYAHGGEIFVQLELSLDDLISSLANRSKY